MKPPSRLFLLNQGCPVSRISFSSSASPYFLCSLTMKSHLFHTYPAPCKSVHLSPSSLTHLDVIFLSHLQLPGFYLSFSLLLPAPAAQAGAGHLKAQTLHGNKFKKSSGGKPQKQRVRGSEHRRDTRTHTHVYHHPKLCPFWSSHGHQDPHA